MQFLNPLFLYGLLALSIPILIHLFNFRRYKKVYFTNVSLLKVLQTETRKQSKLRSLVLLALRLLALSCIVLAFAQPIIPWNNTATAIHKENIHALYCDNSLSMEKLSGPTNIYTEARIIATDIIESQTSQSRFHISENSSTSSYRRLYNREDAKIILSAVETGPEVALISDIIERQVSALSEYSDAAKNLYILSDFQKSTFSLPTKGISQEVKVFLIPLVSPESGNIYIDSVWFINTVQLQNQMSHIGFRIQNKSKNPLSAYRIKLIRNGMQSGITTLNVAPENSSEGEMSIFNDKAGIMHYALEIEDKLSPYDNHFYFTTFVHDAIPVLHIGGKTTSPFLQKFYSAETVYSYQFKESGKLQYTEIPSTDFIILDGIESFPDGIITQLAAQLEQGGAIAIFPSKSADTESYQNLLRQLGFHLQMQADTASTIISVIQQNSPLYKDALMEIPENPLFPTSYFHFRYQFSSNMQAISILKMANGDDFLLEFSKGKGKVYLFAGQLKDDVTDFQHNPLFIPCAYQMPLQTQNSLPPYQFIGKSENVALKFNGFHSTENLRLKNIVNNREFIPISSTKAGFLLLNPGPDIKQAGNYTIEAGNNPIASLAFNTDRRESDPSVYSIAELKNKIEEAELNNVFIIENGKNPVSTQIQDIQQGRKLWKFFIVLALIFIMAELLLLRFWG